MIDVLSAVLFAAFWLSYVPPIVIGERRHGGDVFRDAASAMNIAAGQPFADPAYRDHLIWYPPLSPAIVAGLSALMGIPPLDCYRLSGLFFNWLIPAGLYLLVRRQWGSLAAAGAAAALLLAMPWWRSEIVQGQPSVHAVVWAWCTIGLYVQSQGRGSVRLSAACGAFLGASIWHHPLIPAVLWITFCLNAVWESRSAGNEDLQARLGVTLRNNVIVLALAALIAAPVLYLMGHGPVLNPVPREFVCPELRSGDYALLAESPWLWLLILAGIIHGARRARLGDRLLLCALVLCLVGQLGAYPRILGWGWARRLPIIVPHEFQWTFQLGLAACVGIGLAQALSFLRRRVGFFGASRFATGLITLLVLAMISVPGLRRADQNLRRFVHPFARNFPEVTDWVRHNTDINDVFALDPVMAFAWFNADTGRKVWLTEPGHTNPRVDWARRHEVLTALSDAAAPGDLWQLAHENGIDYLIPSSTWMPRVLADPRRRHQTVPGFLEVAYDGGTKAPSILRVRPDPARRE